MGACGSSLMGPSHWMETESAQNVIDLIRANGYAVNAPVGHHDSTLLHLAVEHNRLGVALWLLSQGADPLAQDSRGYSSLHVAVECSNLHMIRQLVVYVYRIHGTDALRDILLKKNYSGLEAISLCAWTPSTSLPGRLKPPESAAQSPMDDGLGECPSAAFAESLTPSDNSLVDDADRQNPAPDAAVASATLQEVDNEPRFQFGTASLKLLIASDIPPPTVAKMKRSGSSVQIIYFFMRAMEELAHRNNPKVSCLSLIECCVSDRCSTDLAYYAFASPVFFSAQQIQLVQLKNAVERSRICATWHPIIPDCNYSYRALFGRYVQVEPTDGLNPNELTLRRIESHTIQMTPILAAIYSNSIAKVKRLVILGGRSQLLYTDTNGNNALHYAVDTFTRTGDQRILKLFAESFAETQRLAHKTNNNGHRPGQYNEYEAADLGLSTELHPLATIPSAACLRGSENSAECEVPHRASNIELDATLAVSEDEESIKVCPTNERDLKPDSAANAGQITTVASMRRLRRKAPYDMQEKSSKLLILPCLNECEFISSLKLDVAISETKKTS